MLKVENIQHHKKGDSDNVSEYKIEDDGLSPYFNIDDHVAGIEYSSEKINLLLNENVIARLSDGKIITRNLREGKTKDTYTLLCTNANAKVNSPILYDVKLISAARILRHYIRIKS